MEGADSSGDLPPVCWGSAEIVTRAPLWKGGDS